MPVTNGPFWLSEIFTEFGVPAGGRWLSLMRRDNSRIYSQSPNLLIPTSGPVNLSAFRGARDEMVIDNHGDLWDPVVRTLYDNAFGAPSGPVKVRFRNYGRCMGSSHAGYGLRAGQFPAGSYITIENHHQILGGGGVPGGGGVGGHAQVRGFGAGAGGGRGGTALYIEYGSQTHIIHNKANGIIYGGGGGAGGGGGGGGGHYYTQGTGTAYPGSANSCNNVTYDGACVETYGQGWCSSGQAYYTDACGEGIGLVHCGSCAYSYTYNIDNYTWGGDGGGGGYGQGANVGQQGGAGGGAPGTNAGWGGTGGTGGGWGAAGAAGNGGGWGNYQGGGGGGGAGGPAGYWLEVGGAAWGFINDRGGYTGMAGNSR
jgi:hypothetical protein